MASKHEKILMPCIYHETQIKTSCHFPPVKLTEIIKCLKSPSVKEKHTKHGKNTMYLLEL